MHSLNQKWKQNFGLVKEPVFFFSVFVLIVFHISGMAGYRSRLLDSYLKDLLLVPVAVPLLFTGLILLGVRRVEEPVTLFELSVVVFIWALSFEFIGPVVFDRGVSDPVDVLAYASGGLLYWLLRGGKRKQTEV